MCLPFETVLAACLILILVVFHMHLFPCFLSSDHNHDKSSIVSATLLPASSDHMKQWDRQ
jgi:hypothetical protein